MREFSRLDQYKLYEIMIKIYKKSQEAENIKTIDIIEDIKQQVMLINSPNSGK